MSKSSAKKSGRKASVNLTLSPEAIRQGQVLKEQMRRPSLSNVVEYLIEEAALKLGKQVKAA